MTFEKLKNDNWKIEKWQLTNWKMTIDKLKNDNWKIEKWQLINWKMTIDIIFKAQSWPVAPVYEKTLLAMYTMATMGL